MIYFIREGINNMKNKIFGFTLAEVLITLGVIGVVSALTLPSVIKNYQKHVTVDRLKVAYSTLQQAILMAEKDYDVFENWDLHQSGTSGISSYNDGKAFFETYLKPYISSIKTFEINNPYVDEVFGVNTFAFSMKNGTFVTIQHAYERMIFLFVDINGMKGPNEQGKDIFTLLVVGPGTETSYWGIRNKGGLYFQGSGLSRDYLLKNTSHCDCSGLSGNNGNCYKRFCGALIQQDGWKIKDDYPW